MDEGAMLKALSADGAPERRLRALADALDVPDGTVAFYAFGAPRDEQSEMSGAPRSTRVICAPEALGWWTDYCADSDRRARDPVRASIRRGIEPVYWNALVPGADFGRARDGLWQHLRDHRITEGVSIPLHDPGAGRYGSFSLLQFGHGPGLASWLTKSATRLCTAAFVFHMAVSRGGDAPSGICLTPREAECLGLVADGLTSKQIARRLALSPRTVDMHLARACHRLGVSTRAQAVAWALQTANIRMSRRL